MDYMRREDVEAELAGHRSTPPVEVRAAMEPWAYERWTGSDLRAARMGIEMTVAEAAELLGCHPNAYSRWELGQTSPRYLVTRRAVSEFIAEARRIMEGT